MPRELQLGDSARAFRFDEGSRTHLSRILGPLCNPALIARLEVAVTRGRDSWRFSPPEPVDREAKRLLKKLIDIHRSIDRISPTLRMRSGTLADLVHPSPVRDRLAPLRDAVDQAMRFLKGAVSVRRGRGRPRSSPYDSIALDVAMVLKIAGVRLTTSRVGKFGQALTVVVGEAFGDRARAELFPSIKHATDWVKDLSVQDLVKISGRVATFDADERMRRLVR
jgi:hypothetical protein